MKVSEVTKRLLQIFAAVMMTFHPITAFAMEPEQGPSTETASPETIENTASPEADAADEDTKVITEFSYISSYKYTAGVDAPESIDLGNVITAVINGEKAEVPVTWNSDQEYHSEQAGQYTYTGVIPDDYQLAADVSLPVVTIILKENTMEEPAAPIAPRRAPAASGEVKVSREAVTGLTYIGNNTQYVFNRLSSASPISINISFNVSGNETFVQGTIKIKVPSSILKKSDGTTADTFSWSSSTDGSSFDIDSSNTDSDYQVLTNTTDIVGNDRHYFLFTYTPGDINSVKSAGSFSCSVSLLDGREGHIDPLQITVENPKENIKVNSIKSSLKDGAEARTDGTYAWKKTENHAVTLHVYLDVSSTYSILPETLVIRVPASLFKKADSSAADSITGSVVSAVDQDNNSHVSKFTFKIGTQVINSSMYYVFYNTEELDLTSLTAGFDITYTPESSADVSTIDVFTAAVGQDKGDSTVFDNVSNAVTITLYQEADQDTFDVSTEEELNNAVNTINTSENSSYTINILNDINLETIGKGIVLSRSATTINGKGHIVTSKKLGGYDDSILSAESGAKVALQNITFNGEYAAGPMINVTGTGSEVSIRDDVTIKNGLTNANIAGVEVDNGGTFNMNGGTINNCRADSSDGAGILADSGTVNITDGTIENCSSGQSGGGIAIEDSSVFKMTGGTIQNCHADHAPIAYSTIGYGGGIYLEESNFEISGGIIQNNFASTGGGGISAFGGSGTLAGGEITNNHTDSNGGGMFISYDAFVQDTGTKIYNNTASKGGADICTTDVIFDEGTIDLMNASDMGKTYQDTGIPIDGWYQDEKGNRWSNSNFTEEYSPDGTAKKKLYLIAAYRQVLVNVVVSNKVQGNMGDRSKIFNYIVKINGLSAGYNVKLVNGTSETSLSAGTDGKAEGQFQLQHDQSITIQGVPKTASISIEEDKEAMQDGYIVSVAGSNTNSYMNDSIDNNLSIQFTNTREVVVPTGIYNRSTSSFVLFGTAGLLLIILFRNWQKRETE